MKKRTLAIGDIHGCRNALDHLLDFVSITSSDEIITLGDYVDRGPDSKGVIDRLIQLRLTEQLIPLQGNHEVMMINAIDGGKEEFRYWLQCGGLEALESYDLKGQGSGIQDIPAHHRFFLKRQLRDWYETPTHIFVHANAQYDLPMDEQPSNMLNWEFLDPRWHRPHISGKTMICGHTQQRSGLPLDLGSAVCIDTWAYGGGWLTCLNVDTGEYWQTNELGDRRKNSL